MPASNETGCNLLIFSKNFCLKTTFLVSQCFQLHTRAILKYDFYSYICSLVIIHTETLQYKSGMKVMFSVGKLLLWEVSWDNTESAQGACYGVTGWARATQNT